MRRGDDIARRTSLQKKSTMYLAILASWVLTISWFNPRLFTLFSEATSFSDKFILSFFIGCLDLFWIFGSYYLMAFLFTVLSRKTPALVPFSPSRSPPVAMLYLTLNDFQYEAALSCVNQDYQNFHVFIVDSSTQEDKIKEVKRFSRAFREKVTVIRRTDRKGFKAGAINYALRNWVTDYPYFAIIDADGIQPPDFLARLMPYFWQNNHLAFVQGSHRPNPTQKTSFAKDLALGITPIWTIFCGPRNVYGFVMFLGHGGIIRRDIWKRVGGFPEIVAEDLGFATKARELGYYGHYASEVVSYEDFPDTYLQLRKQQEKYVKGGCEFLDTCLSSFLRSKNISWFEKLDVLMSCSSLFLPTIHLIFITTFILVLFVLGEPRPLTLAMGGSELNLWDVHILKNSFFVIWTWDFYAITILNMFAPVLGCISLALEKGPQLVRLLFLSAVPYLSLMVVCTLGIFTYLVTRKAAFLVTGDTSEKEGLYSYASRRDEGTSLIEQLNAGHPITHFLEISVGIVLSLLCLKTLNFALLGISMCLILGFFLLRFGWENKVISPLLFLPFLIIISSMVFLGSNLTGAQGIFLLFFMMHF